MKWICKCGEVLDSDEIVQDDRSFTERMIEITKHLDHEYSANASWYRFWKTVQGHLTSEDYFLLDNEIYAKESTIKAECEQWADTDPGGHNTSYRYGFEKVDTPPSDWLERRIYYDMEDVKDLTLKVMYYTRLIAKKAMEGEKKKNDPEVESDEIQAKD